MALDHAAYLGAADELRSDALVWAWRNYFVQTGNRRVPTSQSIKLSTGGERS
jgi:hypothetical protein